MNKIDYNIFELGDVTLLSGKILLNAKLAYKTYGSLNEEKSNVILLPTFYTGTHKRNEGFFGNNRAINPQNILLYQSICLAMDFLHLQAIVQLHRMDLAFPM